MKDCVFCKIVDRKCPASIFYEDDQVIGFMTIGPVTTGHAMVVPKSHVAYLADMDEETGQDVFKITQRTAAAIRASGVQCEGVNLFLADGKAAFQEVFHVHMNVFPRYKGDSFKLDADWRVKPPREELDRVASQIRVAYNSLWGVERSAAPNQRMNTNRGIPRGFAALHTPAGYARRWHQERSRMI